ncbi:MAG: hypothetical protein ACRD9R_09855 [Pyrinomonadaceae bacterium]
MSRPQRSYAPATCAWCGGKGTQAVSLGYVMSCLVCGGKGHILATQPAERCQQCEGSGKRAASVPCLTCAGTGWAVQPSGRR